MICGKNARPQELQLVKRQKQEAVEKEVRNDRAIGGQVWRRMRGHLGDFVRPALSAPDVDDYQGCYCSISMGFE